jgi:hypothetical protein
MSSSAVALQLARAVSPSDPQFRARAFIFEIAGAGEEEYRAVTEALGQNPPGRLFHFAGPTEEGWTVVDVWESQEAFDAFLTERLLPVVRKVGFFASMPQSFPVHTIVAGPY